MMEDYKKKYEEDDVKEIAAWFEARKDKLPPSLQLDQATNIPDFPRTLDIYLQNAFDHIDNITYDSAVYCLFKMRRRLQEDGLE